MNEPYQVAPGAYVLPSFHGDDGAPFLVIVNRLVVDDAPMTPDGDLYLPDLRLYWSEEGFVTPVRHPVIDADDLDEAYWQGVRALWERSAIARVCDTGTQVVVPAHGVVLRGRRLREALEPCADLDEAPVVACAEEMAAALAGLRAGAPRNPVALRRGEG